ncbi:sugar transferase [Belnapia mucosa]|uniref:sugar transferase n=1 Tax=Belnapia mucosa TaxID=2804532 RepID=UPI0022A663D8|nr:sugar transferase [Belnapia mucosa]
MGDVLRRLLDVTLGSLAVLVLLPVFLLVALAILVEGGRPVFFSQVRLGQYGRPFRMFKFRKFRNDLGSGGAPLTQENDPRLTHIGRALRATKLDELPQLWNVIRGDMSIVGPRPEVPDFVDCFSGELLRILNHRPGILGPSQYVLRNEASFFPGEGDLLAHYRAVLFPIKGHIDLQYYEQRTFLQDLRWMVLTVIGVVHYEQSLPARLTHIDGGPKELLGRLDASLRHRTDEGDRAALGNGVRI